MADDSDKILEEDNYEKILIPKDKQYIVIVFENRGSASCEIKMTDSIMSGQLFSVSGFLDEKARHIIRQAEARMAQSRILKPGHA